FASTKMPRNPATERATSSAACGGQTDKTTPARPDISPAVPTSLIPAASARAAVAGLRPADAHSTVSPHWLRQPPTAAPISPGCSTPITFSSTFTSATSLTHAAKARTGPQAPGGTCTFGKAFSLPNAARPSGICRRATGFRLLPRDLVGLRSPGKRREPASGQNSGHARTLLPAGVNDDQRAARRTGPQDILPARQHLEPVRR